MLKSAEEITQLASLLGTTTGLQRVKAKVDLLSARLADKDLPIARNELATMGVALASLSNAIFEMSRVVRATLAEAGVASDHVG
jgi:hypothetical protein